MGEGGLVSRFRCGCCLLRAACCVGQNTHFRPRLFRLFLLLQPAGRSSRLSSLRGKLRAGHRGDIGEGLPAASSFFFTSRHWQVLPVFLSSLSEKRSITRRAGVSVRASGFRCGKLHGGAAAFPEWPRRCTYRTRCSNMFLCKISGSTGLFYFIFRIYVCRVQCGKPACLVYLPPVFTRVWSSSRAVDLDEEALNGRV